MQLDATTAPDPRFEPHAEHNALSSVARLVADDLPLASLFSRLAKLLDRALGPAQIELVLDSQGSPTYSHGSSHGANAGFTMTLPIRFHTQKLGAMRIIRATDEPLSPDAAALVETCTAYIAIRLHNTELVADRQRFETLAGLDPLTGVSSRREFEAQYAAEWARGVRHGGPLSLLIVDVDHFKAYNDRYGHLAGDVCLQKVAKVLDTSAVRPGDTVARFGGDEFVIILPQTEHAGATLVAEKLRAAVADQRIENVGAVLGVVTLSVGVATRTPSSASPAKALLEKADRALYAAKSGGRNLVVGDGDRTNASPTGRPPHRSNLPPKLSSFFGRVAELDAIDCLMEQTRALTITGPAGIGKTRVALKAAMDHLDDHPDGVWFVDFARVTDAALVAGSLLYVLGDSEERDQQPLATLVERVGDKHMLLLFDNCQRLIEECAAVTEALLRKCPNVRVIATCRDVLRIRGEIAYRIPSLAVHDAADLFVARANAVTDRFAASTEDRRTVERIVRRLDGIPMAIEVVAARIKVMGVRELDQRLEARFPEPATAETAPRPHLLSTIVDWSFNALDDAEQHLLRRLAIFPGDWRMDASAEICAEGDDERRVTLDILSRMVGKALLFSEPHRGGQRYSMFETLHEYGRQLMLELGELATLQRRHALYYRKVADDLDGRRPEPVSEEWTDSVEAEHHNFRAALEWSVLEAGDVETGAALATALAPWWTATSHFREARYWIDHIIWRANEANLSAGLHARVLAAATLIGSRKTDAAQRRSMRRPRAATAAASR